VREDGDRRVAGAQLHVDLLVALREGVQDRAPAAERLGSRGVDLDDDRAAEGGLLGQDGEERLDPGGDAGVRVAGHRLAADGLQDPAQDVGDARVVEREEAVLLPGEVLVEGLARHAGQPDHVRDRRRPVPALRDGLGHRVEQAAALRGQDDVARQRVAPGGQRAGRQRELAAEVGDARREGRLHLRKH